MSITDPTLYALVAVVGLVLFVITLILDLRKFILDPTPDKFYHSRYLNHITAWLLLGSGLLLIIGVFGTVFAFVYHLTA